MIANLKHSHFLENKQLAGLLDKIDILNILFEWMIITFCACPFKYFQTF